MRRSRALIAAIAIVPILGACDGVGGAVLGGLMSTNIFGPMNFRSKPTGSDPEWIARYEQYKLDQAMEKDNKAKSGAKP